MILYLLAFANIAYAQVAQKPTETKYSECLEGCLSSFNSPISDAEIFHKFEQIITKVEEFCSTHQQLVKCVQSCGENDRLELKQKTVLNDYICNEKIEEFRLARECVQAQESAVIDQCAKNCHYPAEKQIQLSVITVDAAINPAAFFSSLSPTCKSLACVMKCSIRDMNTKCAGSGDIFKDIGRRAVVETKTRLQANQNDSSAPFVGQLAGIFLDGAPEECSYLVNPDKFDSSFVEDDFGSEMPTEIASVDDSLTTVAKEHDAGFTPKFGEIDEETSTKIVEIQLETAAPTSADESEETDQSKSESEPADSTEATIIEAPNNSEIHLVKPANVKGENVHEVEGTVEHPGKEPESTENPEEVEPTVQPDVKQEPEQKIVVVNDDGDTGKNEVHNIRRANGAAGWSSVSLFSLIVALLLAAQF